MFILYNVAITYFCLYFYNFLFCCIVEDMLTKEEKNDCIKKACKTKDDTGSSEVQVTLLTKQIQKLNDHLKIHKKDGFSNTRSI